jgi:hypothetical protein
MKTADTGSDLRSKWMAKAERLNNDQKNELSVCVYELNAYFHQYFWSQTEEI